MMDDVHNCDSYINIPASQTYISYVNMSILMITSACCLHNFVILSYACWGLKAVYKLRTGIHPGIFPVVRKALLYGLYNLDR
jgi:hypothetical protein